MAEFCAEAQLLWGSVAAGGALLIWLYGFVFTQRPQSAPWLVWIVLLGAGLGWLQTWRSLPLRSLLASEQLEVQRTLTADPDLEVEGRWAPILASSLYPYATRRDIAALGLIALVTLAASVGIRTKWGTAVVLLGPAVGGAVLAAYGLTMQITGDPTLQEARSLSRGSFAWFVNPNHAGGYFNLCLAASLGVAWWAFSSKTEELKLRAARSFSERWQRILMRCRWEIATLNARKFAALTLVALSAAAAICTLSRGAIVAMIGGALFTVLIVLLGRRSIAGVLAAIAVLVTGIGLTAWVGMSEQVSAELATLVEGDAAASRIELWSSVLPAASRFAPLGSGLGTFRYVYRPYLAGVDRVWFYHAENQYVEALVDGGWVGLILLLLAVGLAAWQIWKLVRGTKSRRFTALGVAAMFALITQAIQATSDFGLYLPSNGWLLGLLVGAAIGSRDAQKQAANADHEPDERGPAAGRLSQSLPAIAMWVLTIGLCSWALVDHYRAARLETAMRAIDVDLDLEPVEAARLDAWLDELRPACVETGSAEGWQRVADLYLARFRRQWMEANLPGDAPEEDRFAAWPLLTMTELHRRVALAFAADGEAGVEAMLVSCGGSQPLAQADDGCAALGEPVRSSPRRT
ncbi:MAG: O-antigen ligase family protein [Pirellulaceae bacterium]